MFHCYLWMSKLFTEYQDCRFRRRCNQDDSFLQTPSAIKQQQQQQQILLKVGKQLITLLSHPQIAYKLIEAEGAEDILQNKIYI